jgi:hypothetical protein
VLSSASRSTIDCVSVNGRAAVGDARRVVGPGLDRHDAAGDRRERRRADRGLRARVQGLEALVVDLQVDPREVVVAELDRLDGADRDAADLHEVALDELARVVHLHVDEVAAATRPEQHDSGDRRHHQHPGHSHDRPQASGQSALSLKSPCPA